MQPNQSRRRDGLLLGFSFQQFEYNSADFFSSPSLPDYHLHALYANFCCSTVSCLVSSLITAAVLQAGQIKLVVNRFDREICSGD